MFGLLFASEVLSREVSPIIYILVPADALVLQHRQLRRRIQAQEAGR